MLFSRRYRRKMKLIRRIWLIPAFLVLITIYYFAQIWRFEDHQYGLHHAKVHLDPSKYKPRYPITSYVPLPTDTAKSIPKIQHDFSKSPESTAAQNIRLQWRDAVKESFLHAWKGYRRLAWTKDEVSPLSGKWRNSFGGWGATMVDTMDTLWMMELYSDFEDCVKATEKIDFTSNTEETLNVFETTIRYLGGLLAAYDISEGRFPSLLAKAKELGDILYLPFDTPNHMPVARWEWIQTALGELLGTASVHTLNAELGSLTLEFTRLSQLTGDPKYFDVVQRVETIMAETQNSTKIPGLWPTIVNARDLTFTYNHFTFGGMADSTYEYLPKEYLLLGGLNDVYRSMYLTALEVAKQRLFFRPLTPQDSDILFSGNAGLDSTRQTVTELQGQHLSCFVGGMVGIGSRIFSRPEDLSIARKLVDGCIWAYSSMPSGLMPELFNIAHCHVGIVPAPEANLNIAAGDCAWSDDRYYTAVAHQQPSPDNLAGLTKVEAGKWWVRQKSLVPPFTELPDNRYILRPEAIESIFILYRITGDTSLLDSAWTMFQAIEKATRTPIAHAGVSDVRNKTPRKLDRMESFWLAETLKYFYLIFSEPDLVSLDEYVLNTEAHPFRRPKAGEKLVVMN